MSTQLHTTPLDAWHQSAGARMVPFSGYSMPVHYGSIVAEHVACRTAGALFDVSHMGRLRFEGERADQFLDSLLTRRVAGLALGQTRYSLMCREDGGVLDDVLVSRLSTPSEKEYYLMVVNASNRAKIIEWITPHLERFPYVTMTDRTELTAMIAVQGPAVLEACSRLFKFDPRRLKYYRSTITEHLGKPVIVSRTGYTGEDGIELIVRAEDATRVWENMLLAGRDSGFVPAGLAARDTLRTEAAMPLYGHELSEAINPIEAGLSFACDLEGRDFVGRDAVAEVAKVGPARVRVGLIPEGKRPVREGAVIQCDGVEVGVVTSGCPSPTLGHPIAMGTVQSEYASRPVVTIDLRGASVDAKITPLPFYRRSV